MSDEEIVTMALRDKAFFGHIVFRYEGKLTRYVHRLGVHSNEDQQDVLQDIFVKIYKNLNSFDTSLSFSSWIYRIAHNESISWYRKTNVRPEGHLVDSADDIFSFTASTDSGAETLFDQDVNAEVVTQALMKLDDKYRSAIVLRFFEHKEYEEISDILKIPVGSVGTLIHRGKQKLKTEINQERVRI